MSFAGLQGKAAVVTGAGSGIGAASARRLSAEGVAVVLVDRSEEAVSEVAATLPGKSAVSAPARHGDTVVRATGAWSRNAYSRTRSPCLAGSCP